MASRATRVNRSMMWGMTALAVLLFAIVFGMLYLSFQDKEPQKTTAGSDSIILSIDSDTLAHP